MIVKRIGPLSLAKIGGIIYAALGFIIGVFISLFALAGLFGSVSLNNGMGIFLSLFFGLGAVIFLPVLYGILGFVMGILVAWLYNVFAGLVGGIELEVQRLLEAAPVPRLKNATAANSSPPSLPLWWSL
jgi:hypothetical protein